MICETGVTFIKRNKHLIGKHRVYLYYQNISSVRIDRNLIDTTIIISGRGAVALRLIVEAKGVKSNYFGEDLYKIKNPLERVGF